ncbi:MAG: cytochrome c3 family protein [Rhizobacter sp.]|nr:cytochrome c3 family protein [Chlorobiales bacterium]
MAQIFPRWTNTLPTIFAGGVSTLALGVIGFFWYYGSPKFTDVGYRPDQPVQYSHKLHAGDMGMDCRYCHSQVEKSSVANVPATQTCMNCHKIVAAKSEKLLAVRESYETGKPIEWVRVHKVPDFAYFNHSAHVNVGVGCSSCHGNIAQMEVVAQAQPLSMGWCLDCHRNPDMALRPKDKVTAMDWTPGQDLPGEGTPEQKQLRFAAAVKLEKHINPPVNCSGCHR